VQLINQEMGGDIKKNAFIITKIKEYLCESTHTGEEFIERIVIALFS